jgi:hypothetical protein
VEFQAFYHSKYMSKSLRNFIIGIGTASILFSLYRILRGGEFMDALGGIVIGVSLIGAIIIEQNKNKKAE